MNVPIDNYQYDDAIELEDRTTAEWKGQIQNIHLLLQLYNCSPDLPETSAIPSIDTSLKILNFPMHLVVLFRVTQEKLH